jgi:hypothetical protein
MRELTFLGKILAIPLCLVLGWFCVLVMLGIWAHKFVVLWPLNLWRATVFTFRTNNSNHA